MIKRFLKIKNWINIFESVLLFSISAFVFHFIIYNVSNDINDHLIHVKKIIENQADYPAHFGFFIAVSLLSQIFDINLINVGIITLSCSVAAKYFLSKKIIYNNIADSSTFSEIRISLLTFALFFCFAIPDPYSILILRKYAFGKFIPMVWHNSTLLFVFPFAIVLFWRQLKVITSNQKTTLVQILILSILVLINIIIKPSFILVYLPITFLFMVYKFRGQWNAHFFFNLIPVAFGGILILVQSILIFKFESGNIHDQPSGIAIGEPFKVFRHFVPAWYIPIGFTLSFLLPIITVLSYRKILKDISFQYATFLLIAGILIGAFVYETGPRMYHGNFLWQNVICAYLLFLSTFKFICKELFIKKPWQLKEKILLSVLLLHVISGILYIIKIMVTQDYS